MAASAEALKKLEEQLKCSICLDTYTDPKLLKCNHAFCHDCIAKKLIIKRGYGYTLTCPKCHELTLGPPKGMASLHPALDINHLLEILSILKAGSEQVTPLGSGCCSHSPASQSSEPSEQATPLGSGCCSHSPASQSSERKHEKVKEMNFKDIVPFFEPMGKQLEAISEALIELDTLNGEAKNQQEAIENSIHNTMCRLVCQRGCPLRRSRSPHSTRPEVYCHPAEQLPGAYEDP